MIIPTTKHNPRIIHIPKFESLDLFTQGFVFGIGLGVRLRDGALFLWDCDEGLDLVRVREGLWVETLSK